MNQIKNLTITKIITIDTPKNTKLVETSIEFPPAVGLKAGALVGEKEGARDGCDENGALLGAVVVGLPVGVLEVGLEVLFDG